MKRKKAYWEYILYSTKLSLKSRVAGSYLGYVWWILEPLLLMLVFVLVFGFIRQRGRGNYSLFYFVGIISWQWFSSCVSGSATSIRSRMGIIEQIAVPQFIFPLIDLLVGAFLNFTGLIPILCMMIYFKVPFTFHIFEYLPIAVANGVFIFGLTLIVSHIGVFFVDIKNMMSVVMRLWFYLSPILYEVKELPQNYQLYWWFNPMTTFLESSRNVFLYGKSPYYLMLLVWLLIGFWLVVIGIYMQKKYGNSYAKAK